MNDHYLIEFGSSLASCAGHSQAVTLMRTFDYASEAFPGPHRHFSLGIVTLYAPACFVSRSPTPREA